MLLTDLQRARHFQRNAVLHRRRDAKSSKETERPTSVAVQQVENQRARYQNKFQAATKYCYHEELGFRIIYLGNI